MNYEIKDCIDAGSEYCPCHLAETGDCIICSQLAGKGFCDCLNWKGVCIYQEFINNGAKAKEGRKYGKFKILNIYTNENLLRIDILVSHKIAIELQYPGSYVFFKKPSASDYFNVPISIMESDLDNNTIKVAIELRGVKTKALATLKNGSMISMRYPFYNGVLGLKRLCSTKEKRVLVCARGIGAAPSIPAIKKLFNNSNEITYILDRASMDLKFIDTYLKKYTKQVIEMNILNKGELTKEFKDIIKRFDEEDVSLIHCDGPDIMIYNTINYYSDLYCKKRDIKEELVSNALPLTSSNNAKMCCGEGVCGACSVRYENHVVKRLCKYQSNPINIFRHRRYI